MQVPRILDSERETSVKGCGWVSNPCQDNRINKQTIQECMKGGKYQYTKCKKGLQTGPPPCLQAKPPTPEPKVPKSTKPAIGEPE